jgi:hypothetical protein
MGRKNGAINQETMRIRMSSDLLRRIQAAKIPAGWGEEADSSFARHLLILVVDEVERITEERQKKEILLPSNKKLASKGIVI